MKVLAVAARANGLGPENGCHRSVSTGWSVPFARGTLRPANANGQVGVQNLIFSLPPGCGGVPVTTAFT